MRFIIAGNGPAGYYTATKLKAAEPSADITIIDRQPEPFYTKIRLPEYIAGTLPREKLVIATAGALAEKGISLKSGCEITSVKTADRTLIAGGESFPFDVLVLAAGGVSFIPPLEGDGAPDILALRTLADGDRIAALAVERKTAAILGGGLLGLETAHALTQRGVAVSVVEFFPQLLPKQLTPAQGEKVREILSSKGFAFYLGRKAHTVLKTGSGYRILTGQGDDIACGFVLASAGVRPDLSLARGAGLDTNRGVLVNDRFESSVPGIYALGDCAEMEGQTFGLWMTAMAQAEGLVRILTGKAESFINPVYKPIIKIPGVKTEDL
jgi:nitrite reductase (NADH) large subunit